MIRLFAYLCFLLGSLAGVEAVEVPHPLKVKSVPVRPGPMPTPPLREKNELVVIDAGHGGDDVGTQSISKPRYQEKSLNLVTAKFLRQYLKQMGFRVAMTRNDDRFIALDKRAEFANKKKAALFISVHYNSAPSAEARGVEVFYYQSKENRARTLASKHLANDVLKSILRATQAPSRGVKHGNFAVIRETEIPAILVEGGFVTNEEDLKNLKDPAYLKKLAWGMAEGIQEYLNKVE